MTPLDHLRDRLAATDPAFLAHSMLTWQIRTGGGDADLAALLGVPAAALTRLGLCWRPRDAGDVERIEAAFGVRRGALAEIL